MTLVGLDVTMTTWLGAAELARLEGHPSPRARFVWSVLQHYLQFYWDRYGRTGCPLHDPAAARVAVDPTLAGYLETPVRVELASTVSRGMLIVDRRPFAPHPPGQPEVRIATEVDAERLKARFLEGLTGGPLG